MESVRDAGWNENMNSSQHKGGLKPRWMLLCYLLHCIQLFLHTHDCGMFVCACVCEASTRLEAGRWTFSNCCLRLWVCFFKNNICVRVNATCFTHTPCCRHRCVWKGSPIRRSLKSNILSGWMRRPHITVSKRNRSDVEDGSNRWTGLTQLCTGRKSCRLSSLLLDHSWVTYHVCLRLISCYWFFIILFLIFFILHSNFHSNKVFMLLFLHSNTGNTLHMDSSLWYS